MKVFLISCFLLAYNLSLGQINLTPKEKKWIEEHPVIEYGFSSDWKPFESVNGDEYEGIAREFLDIVSTKTGIQFKGIAKGEWKDVLSSFKSKSVDLLPCVFYKKERENFISYTKSYAEGSIAIVTKKGHPYVYSLDYFNHKTIVMPVSDVLTSYIEKHYPNIKILYTHNVDETLMALSTGKAEATISFLPVISYYMYYEGYNDLQISGREEKYGSLSLHIGLHHKDSLLLGIINKAIDNIHPNEKNAIYAKWISVQHNQDEEVNRVLLISLIGFVVLMGVLFFYFRFNKKLKKEIHQNKLYQEKLEKARKELEEGFNYKNFLLKEVHHRVKNNLQLLNSLIRLKSRNETDYKKVCNSIQTKISIMAALHDNLYESDHPNRINPSNHIKWWISELIGLYSEKEKISLITDVTIKHTIDAKTMLSIDLIINELLANSLKYAFSNINQPKIKVTLKRINDKELGLYYADNGIGFSDKILNQEIDSFGVGMVKILTEELEGNITVIKEEDYQGFSIVFPYRFSNGIEKTMH